MAQIKWTTTNMGGGTIWSLISGLDHWFTHDDFEEISYHYMYWCTNKVDRNPGNNSGDCIGEYQISGRTSDLQIWSSGGHSDGQWNPLHGRIRYILGRLEDQTSLGKSISSSIHRSDWKNQCASDQPIATVVYWGIQVRMGSLSSSCNSGNQFASESSTFVQSDGGFIWTKT